MLDESRLERLLSAYFDQELGPGEKHELEQMLLASERAREMFRTSAQWHGLTREWALRSHHEDALPSLPDLPGRDAEEEKIIAFPFQRLVWTGLSIAACLALAWVGYDFFVASQPAPRQARVKLAPEPSWRNDVALLAQAINVEWEPGGNPHSVGAALPKGWLKIRSGLLRLDFYSGARVYLEGPAEIELLSASEARLDKGKLTARVTPPAEGFTVHNGDLRVVDRGTEFGMNVTGPRTSEVHVFEGKIALQGGSLKSGEKVLTQGDGATIREGNWESAPSDRGLFLDPSIIRDAAARESEEQWLAWKAYSERLRATPGLRVYFNFEDMEPGSQVVVNKALDATKLDNGTIVGSEPCAGRWRQKGALGFASTSDRVRFRTEGESSSVTLMAWVRVDSLPQDHNALMSMSPNQKGELHWKLDRKGCLLLGLRKEDHLGWHTWERLASPPIITDRDFGRWICLATVVDGDKGIIKHYMNGREVASGPMGSKPKIQFGIADLGNYGSGLSSAEPPKSDSIVRNFNGRMDEFALVSRAMSAKEIEAMSRESSYSSYARGEPIPGKVPAVEVADATRTLKH